MVSNLKELIRWLAFIPVPLIIGPLVGALILIPIFFIFPNIVENGLDIPTKLILTSIMWIVIFWFGAFLKPNNLPMNAFRIIWILLTTLCIFRFLIQNSSFDWRYQLLEIIIPIYFFPYSGNYPNRAMFMTSVNLRYKKMLGFIPKEEQLIGLFGWSPPTIIFAVSLFLETLFLTFNGSPFALLSFFGAIIFKLSVLMFGRLDFINFLDNFGLPTGDERFTQFIYDVESIGIYKFLIVVVYIVIVSSLLVRSNNEK